MFGRYTPFKCLRTVPVAVSYKNFLIFLKKVLQNHINGAIMYTN